MVLLPNSFTTVTRFSKILALTLFVILPFIGFYLGFKYGKALVDTQLTSSSYPINFTPTPKVNYDISDFNKEVNYIDPDSSPDIITMAKIISNWKTYKNSYFTFRYPSNWEVIDAREASINEIGYALETKDVFRNEYLAMIAIRPKTMVNDWLASIEVVKNPETFLNKPETINYIVRLNKGYALENFGSSSGKEIDDKTLNIIHLTLRYF